MFLPAEVFKIYDMEPVVGLLGIFLSLSKLFHYPAWLKRSSHSHHWLDPGRTKEAVSRNRDKFR